MKQILFSFLLLSVCGLCAQKTAQPASADIYNDLKKLEVVGSALYIAAHPDDENTRMIAYLSNHLNVETTYLSLTRGDGGQNLIGTEIKELLGLLRTQELLAARRTDGGNQMFTRANDFGYSKSPEETKEIWNKDAVLSDVVWAIRKLQPDIIINRFSHDSDRKTHGHHTSSAQLSVEAMGLCGNSSAFPDQLSLVSPWKPQRLFFNTSWWFYGSRDKFAKADKSRMIPVDVGVYYPILGKSNTEIAAESRSKHRCQGFGSTGTRGSQMEYLQLIEGSMPKEEGNPFDGIDLSWNRVAGGSIVAKSVAKVIDGFDFARPSQSVVALIALRKEINALSDNPYKRKKIKALDRIILDCAGVYAELRGNTQYVTRGEDVKMDLDVICRNSDAFELVSVSFDGVERDSVFEVSFIENESKLFQFRAPIPYDMDDRSPYWLREKGSLGMYKVDDRSMVGIPENPDLINAHLTIRLEGEELNVTVPLVYTSTDPAIGQQYFPFDVLPHLTANIEKEVYVFGNNASRSVSIELQAHKEGTKGYIKPILQAGWSVSPTTASFQTTLRGEVQRFEFEITPPEGQSESEMKLNVAFGEEIYDQSLTVVEYEHIPKQVILSKASTKLVKVDLERAGNKVAYIMGAGDKVPENLEQIGYEVDIISEEDISTEALRAYDAVILGIRALNTQKWLEYKTKYLLQYVNEGGNIIYQYNTSRRIDMSKFSPYELQLSRDRVTKEEAEMRMLSPGHPVLNWPNKISDADFDGWVQERGLYFPDKWGKEFQAIISSNDPGETPKDGGLLIAQYGKGYIVYTGYSYFRQLPAGVPGAFRLFANMISLGKNKS